MTVVLEARNAGRALLAQGAPLSEDALTDIVDFRDSTMGAVQAVWEGQDINSGTFELWVSLFPLEASFARMAESAYTMNEAEQSVLWHLPAIGFRYARVVYKANGITTGTFTVAAFGKKAGGSLV